MLRTGAVRSGTRAGILATIVCASNPGILRLLPTPLKLWQASMLAYKKSKIMVLNTLLIKQREKYFLFGDNETVGG